MNSTKNFRIGGRIIALENTSEANRKTDLPSVYLSDDLQKAKERLDPWLWENGEGRKIFVNNLRKKYYFFASSTVANLVLCDARSRCNFNNRLGHNMRDSTPKQDWLFGYIMRKIWRNHFINSSDSEKLFK